MTFLGLQLMIPCHQVRKTSTKKCDFYAIKKIHQYLNQYIILLQMLGTGTTHNTTEQPEHATLEGQGDLPPQSNLPESPQLQSHLPSLQQLDQDGYDSYSGINYNVAINSEGPLELDEPDIPEVGASSSTSTGVSDEQNAGNFVDIPEEQLKKLKVVELKSELAKCSQPVSGLKNVLLESLKAALQQRLPLLTQVDQAACSVDDLTGFSPNACWKALVLNDESVVELQIVTGLCAPTIPEDDATFVPQKHNFSETFDRAPFGVTGMETLSYKMGRRYGMRNRTTMVAPRLNF